MANGNKAAEAGGGAGDGGFDLKSLLVAAPVKPHIVSLTPDQGSPVIPQRVDAESDIYLSISVLSFYHPEARRGLTRQVPLIFADAKWRRPTDSDLPQLAVMGPNPEAHENLRNNGSYAFGGRTFFGPERYDGSVDLNIGLHLFRDNKAARKLIDFAKMGSKMMPKGGTLVLGKALDSLIDGGLSTLQALLPDQNTPWILGVVRSLGSGGEKTFETGAWAVIAGGGPEPGAVRLDGHTNQLLDAKGKPLQRAYVVYAVDATTTNRDKLRIPSIRQARERLRQAHLAGESVSSEKLSRLFQHFCQEVELSDELTMRDRDEIIADAKLRFDRMMAQRSAFNFTDDPTLYPSREVSPEAISPKALSAFAAQATGADVATQAAAAIDTSLEALAAPEVAAAKDEGLEELIRELNTAVSDFAALVRSNPEPYREQARQVAKKLRDKREFKTLVAFAESVRDGGVEIGWLNYFAAAADIEINGVPSLEDLARAARGDVAPAMVAEAYLAKAMQLAGKDFENDARLMSDCLGLQGRIWKQRAVRAREVNEAAQQAFERSYSFYMKGLSATMQAPPADRDPQFHQVNLFGLMNAAERRGIKLGKKADAVKWARAILKDAKTGGAPTEWALANAGDAALYLGREAEAAEYYKAYLDAAKGKPFAVNATRRQLIEVWGVDPKGNTDLAGLVRLMGQLSIQSMATVSLTVEEIEAMAEASDAGDGKLEALLGGPPAMPAKQIRRVLQLAQNVGKVTAPNGRAIGTGFLLHGRHIHPVLANEFVFLTNDHVVCDEKTYGGACISSSDACIIFEDLNPDENYKVSEVFWRSDSRVHDCAILRLHRQPGGVQFELEVQDSLPLRHQTETGQADKVNPANAPRVFIIGHPNGRGLEITFEQNYLVDHELRNSAAKATPKPVRIHYRAPTEPGNSGSPVLSANSLGLMGIHHKTTTEPLSRPLRPNETYQANEGMWIQSIIAAVLADKGNAPVSAAPPSGGQPAGPQPAPVAAPTLKPAPAAAAAGLESLVEGDEAFLENMDGRLDTEESGYEGMGLGVLESGKSAVAAFGTLNPKPKAKWAPLAHHPDTQHLAHHSVDLNNGLSFSFGGAVLRQALAVASTPVGANWSRRVLFGIRGAAPKVLPREAAPPEFADTLQLMETEPDHLDYLCAMGVWDRDTDRVWVCPASTVPAIGYLWHATHERDESRMGMGANMLPPGVYTHVVGTHANGGGTRQPGAFRQASKYCVMRLASPELAFRAGNVRWDTTSDANGPAIWNNIHAGLVAGPNWLAKHYSAGCQVVKGSVSTSATRDTPVGHWANFRIAAGLSPKPDISAVGDNPKVVKTAEDGTAFTYVLLTAREVRLASENMGTPVTDLKFFKLRRGSQGDTVRALQTALGLNADGDFGYLTQRALIEKQLALGQMADGVVTSANAAALGIA